MTIQLYAEQHECCRVTVGYDTTSAEEWAMLAALFSRSIEGVESIVERVNADKSSSFMEKTYIGYGHASIGDLADIKVFVEGVPFYVAAVLEHHSRFRGQESSTRYIDFSEQKPAYDADADVYKTQINTYLTAVEKVFNNIKTAYYSKGDIEGPAANRAMKARAFDICRSLLPRGATTNVAWYGDIRTITGHLAWLVCEQNKNAAITNIKPYVDAIYRTIATVYPSSVKLLVDTRPADPYPYYFNGGQVSEQFLMCTHPEQQPLDFGSWRDLNRHRVGKHYVDFRNAGNMHPWYDNMLNEHEVEWNYTSYPQPPINARLLGQELYYTYGMHLEQAIYLIRLRSKPAVHPTLRSAVKNFAQRVESNCGSSSPLVRRAVDITPDCGTTGFFLQRGNDTITFNGKELS